MSLRALIVDDESDARENLRIMLDDNCPDVEVVAQAGSSPACATSALAMGPSRCALRTRFIAERIECAEGGRPELEGEPEVGAVFGFGHGQCAFQEGFHFGFFTRFRF